ncbi:MAG: DUF4339 domain-containing protein [Sodaliphilus sp.]
MEKKYYFVQNGTAYGPISPAEFQRYGITSQTMVCPEGGNQWVPAGTLSELSSVFGPKSATPPPFRSVTPPPPPPTSKPVSDVPPRSPKMPVSESETEFEKTNRMPYIIGSVVAVAIVVLIVVFLVFDPNKSKPNYTINTDEDTEEYIAPDQEEEVEEEEIFTGGVGVELAQMAYQGSFFGITENATSSELSALGGYMTGIQRKVDYEGYHLQIFFADPYTSYVTGIAASKDLTYSDQSVYDACREFEEVMSKKCDKALDSPRTYVTSNGCYASAGYVGSKFYVYFYFPNATGKDPAPRK